MNPVEKPAAKPDEPVFEDSPDLPRGRKARTVSPALEAALEDSAKRNVGKIVTGSEVMIGALLSDLGSASVKRRYVITTETETLDRGKRRLKFSATAKPTE